MQYPLSRIRSALLNANYDLFENRLRSDCERLELVQAKVSVEKPQHTSIILRKP